MRKIDLELLIWAWYCYLLILLIEAASTPLTLDSLASSVQDVYGTESTHEDQEFLGKRVKIFSPIRKGCAKVSKV